MLSEAPPTKNYRVAHSYVDRGNPHLAGDEFSGWLAIDGKTIGMTGGIRPRSYLHQIGVRLTETGRRRPHQTRLARRSTKPC